MKVTDESIIIDPVDLDIALSELKETVLNQAFSNESVFGDIELGVIDDGMEGEETQTKLHVAKFLKAKSVIEDFEVVERQDTIMFSDMDNEQADEIPFSIFVARCKFKPQKLLGFMQEQWQPKLLQLQKISDLYLKLIKVVEAYFRNSSNPDVQLNMYYTQLDKQINLLLSQFPLPRLKIDYWKPFIDLLSAQKQIEKTEVSLQTHLNSMYAYYGRIQDFLLAYNLEKPDMDIQGLDKYLGQLNSAIDSSSLIGQGNKKSFTAISKFSDANLIKIGKICDLITDEIEIQSADSSIRLIKIRYEKFHAIKIPPVEAKRIIKVINDICDEQLVVVKNDDFSEHKPEHRLQYNSSENSPLYKAWQEYYEYLDSYGVDEMDLSMHLLIEFKGQRMTQTLYQLKTAMKKKIEHAGKKGGKPKQILSSSGEESSAKNNKLSLYFSEDNGLFLDRENKKPNYPISGKRAKFVNLLRGGKKLAGNQISEILKQNLPLISKEVDAINNNCKSKLGLTDDFIIRVATGGYKLNNDKYTIQFID